MAEVAVQNGAGQAAKLGTLADKINAEHRACQSAAKTALEHAMNAGDLLIEAKDGCPHGTWQAWVDDNFDGSLRTAQVYTYLARRREEVGEVKAQSSALLSISEVLHKLHLRHAELLPAPPELQQVTQPVAEQPAGQPPVEYSRESRDVWQEHREYLAKKYIWDQAELAVRRGDREQPTSVDIPAQEWQDLVERTEEQRIKRAESVLFRVLKQLNDMHFSIEYWELRPQEAGAALARMDGGDHPVTLPIREGAIADLRFGIAWLRRVLEEADRMQDSE